MKAVQPSSIHSPLKKLAKNVFIISGEYKKIATRSKTTTGKLRLSFIHGWINPNCSSPSSSLSSSFQFLLGCFACQFPLFAIHNSSSSSNSSSYKS
jgi:hypothetical protein